MIRINLLLVREVKRRLELQRQIQVACVLLVLTVAAGVWGFYQQGQIHRAREDKLGQLEKELKSLEKILKEVEDFKEQSALLRRKIEAIEAIKTSQRVPAPYLNEISRRLPEQVWLVGLQETGAGMKISGKSLNGNPGVADFMKNIERSPLFGTAGLVESRSEAIQDRQVMSFTITVPLIMPKKVQATS
ncbi:MAG: PilN domain-containing protein [Dehalococcoidia bacterium]